MPRPEAKGLDYISMDVTTFDDIKIRKLGNRCGNGRGQAIYMRLMLAAYHECYYLEMDDDMIFLMADASHEDEQFVRGVIDACLELGLFDERMYKEHGILTSKRIQETYNKTMARLKRNYRVKEYSLLDVKELPVIDLEIEEETETKVSSEETPVISEETEAIDIFMGDDEEFLPNNDFKTLSLSEKESTKEKDTLPESRDSTVKYSKVQRGGGRDIDTSSRNAGAGARERSQASNDAEIVKRYYAMYYFFSQNWVTPAKETERFIRWYSSPANLEKRKKSPVYWPNLSSEGVQDLVSRWAQAPATEGRTRFDQNVLDFWLSVLDHLFPLDPEQDFEKRMHFLSDRLSFKLVNNASKGRCELNIRCDKIVYWELENNLDYIKPILAHYLNATAITYTFYPSQSYRYGKEEQ